MSIFTTVRHPRSGRHQPPSLPSFALHPKTPSRSWDQIPLGATAVGEAVWLVSTSPHAHLAGPKAEAIASIEHNVVAHLLQYRNTWEMFGIDLSHQELGVYRERLELVEAVAEDLGSALAVLRHVHNVMLHRYETMGKNQLSHFDQLPRQPRAFMVMIHDAHRVLESRSRSSDPVRGEMTQLIMEIARLGGAAGIHLLLTTPCKSMSAVHGELKQNLGMRIASGYMGLEDSLELLDDDAAYLLVDSKGRGYLQANGSGEPFQSYSLKRSELDEL